MTNIERNMALSALIGSEGYEAAEECPQGHNEDIAVDPDYSIGDPVWTEDLAWGAGVLCLTCIVEDARKVHWSDETPEEYLRAQSVRGIRQADPSWHPEWRIQPTPKDFMVPGVLEPLARELVKRWGEEEMVPWGWMMDYENKPDGLDYNVDIWIEDCDCIVGEGEGRTYEIALGEALLAAARNR